MKPFPVSLFDNVKSNQPSDCCDLDFDDFGDILEAYSQTTYSGKDAAPLICTTRFSNGYRRKSNATVSGIITLDIDDGIKIGAVCDAIDDLGITATVCSTASHRTEHHKFRVFVPLIEPASYEDHRLVWKVLNDTVSSGFADTSKIGCESMYYVPGTYPGAPTEFVRFSGDVYSAQEWIDAAGGRDAIVSQAVSQGTAISGSITNEDRSHPVTHHNGSRREAGFADLSLARTRLITDRALAAYQSPVGSYHHARFTLMMSIAGRARTLRVNLSPEDLVSLFNQVDLDDGGHYQTPKYQKEIRAEAQKALSHVN